MSATGARQHPTRTGNRRPAREADRLAVPRSDEGWTGSGAPAYPGPADGDPGRGSARSYFNGDVAATASLRTLDTPRSRRYAVRLRLQLRPRRAGAPRGMDGPAPLG